MAIPQDETYLARGKSFLSKVDDDLLDGRDIGVRPWGASLRNGRTDSDFPLRRACIRAIDSVHLLENKM